MTEVRVEPQIIDGKAVKSLVEASALSGATILGQRGGWNVVVRYGALERAVAAQRARRPRLWRHLDTAASFVRKELGLARFEVDSHGHERDLAERRRPDTAERQRRAHRAAAYDAWFVEQARIGIAAADRGEFVPDDEVQRRFARILGE